MNFFVISTKHFRSIPYMNSENVDFAFSSLFRCLKIASIVCIDEVKIYQERVIGNITPEDLSNGR